MPRNAVILLTLTVNLLSRAIINFLTHFLTDKNRLLIIGKFLINLCTDNKLFIYIKLHFTFVVITNKNRKILYIILNRYLFLYKI